MSTRIKPEILSVCQAAASRLFVIEAVRVRFANGREAEFERVSSSEIPGAVIVLPMIDDETCVLVNEYVVGMDRYELSLPKGLVQTGENVIQAARRELAEEAGCSARRMVPLTKLSIAAGFLCYETHIILALGLGPCAAQGDEPEPLERVHCRFSEIERLVLQGKLTDARTIAALFLGRSLLSSTDLELGKARR